MKKLICETYKKHGLSITIKANKNCVQFLDVELNLKEGSYKPFIKPNDHPLYVNVRSNHPRTITRNIPENVNKRLSALSSSKEMFDSVANIYQEALDKAGYTFKLKYDPKVVIKNKKSRNRKRHDVIYFNPPYSSNIQTNWGGGNLAAHRYTFSKIKPF